MTFVKVVLKFCYDQINISYRNALLKNMSNPGKFGGHKNIAKLYNIVFILNYEISIGNFEVLW